MIWAISGSVLFKVLDQKRRRAGFYVGMIAVLYGPFRFGSDFLRTIDIRHFGLTAAQFWAIGIFAVGVAVLYMRRNAPVVEPVATTPEQAKG
jgi:prolipoprotein diacylglyceryltransferase